MTHTSIKLETPCEIINITPLNPLISKCQIKVCYVGQDPNRNGSIITKEVASSMANTLPGSPIVGYYNEYTEDFEEHNRRISISGDKIKFEDPTRPYGFVDLGAQVWFQDYLDDGVVHTYLVTEGYLWTGQYPETKRIIQNGNNQSMELDEETLKGSWTIDDKKGMEFFIINEAIISKLCILGEEYEPCFEGASITKFSLDDDFNNEIYKLMKEVQRLKGGNSQVIEEENVQVETEIEEEVISEPEVTEAVEVEVEPEVEVEEPSSQFSLDDYNTLTEEYNSLQSRFNDLVEEFQNLQNNYNTLLAFKQTKDREEKQNMIDSFYMLSEAEKEDVQNNIDTYSLEEIEAKLAIICVHNKLDLSEKTEENEQPNTAFSLESLEDSEDVNTPGWVSALRKIKENK